MEATVDDETELVGVVAVETVVDLVGATAARYPAVATKITTTTAIPIKIVLFTNSSYQICADLFECFFHSFKKTEVSLPTFNFR